MIGGSKQEQEAGEGALAIQAGGNVLLIQKSGFTYSEVREIALDVVKGFYGELSGLARTTAETRIEEITDKVLDRIKDRPDLLQQAADPGFQRSMRSVQVEYAATGDKELGDLLVDLLVDRAAETERNMAQIVLNESINVAPKLTASQLNTIALIFFFRHSQVHVGALDELAERLDRFVAPFIDGVALGESAFQHMQFAGCGSSIPFSHLSLEQLIFEKYRGLFSLGIEESEVNALNLSQVQLQMLFARCANDLSKVQTKGLTKADFENYAGAFELSADQREKVLSMFDRNPMPIDQVREKLTAMRPYMGKLIPSWNDSGMKSFTLTSVGLAIGHANLKRVIGGPFADLSTWVKDG